jgi:glycosyltransferase involved in cell wall biosynthesis
MKILVVCQYYYPEPFRITDICETLVRRGHEVTVLTGLPNYPEGIVLKEYKWGKKRLETINGVKIIRTFEMGRGNSRIKLFLNYYSFAISASLKARFFKEEFDVILVNQLSPVMMSLPAKVYKKRYHKKILLYCLDLWPDSLVAGGIKENSFIYNIFYKISRRIYLTADKIFVSSDTFKDYFINKLRIAVDNIDHLPQYAEDIFDGYTSKDIYSNISSPVKNAYNFVFAGNVGEMQSVETIIKAANELKQKEEIAFHIVGSGSKLDECKKLAENYNLKNIFFYGRRPLEQMPDFYNMADAMLITLKGNTTISNTLSGKIQSYMAFGKPIIGSVNGETARVILESGCGFCCPAEDPKGLAKIIMEFCMSEKKVQMSGSAKAYYTQNFSKQRFFETLEQSLLQLQS